MLSEFANQQSGSPTLRGKFIRESLMCLTVPPPPPGVNTAAVDPITSSVLINSQDGVLYRWHLPSNSLSERITMNAGVAQSYTPTAIGPDGRIYAINNAVLHAIGQ